MPVIIEENKDIQVNHLEEGESDCKEDNNNARSRAGTGIAEGRSTEVTTRTTTGDDSQSPSKRGVSTVEAAFSKFTITPPELPKRRSVKRSLTMGVGEDEKGAGEGEQDTP